MIGFLKSLFTAGGKLGELAPVIRKVKGVVSAQGQMPGELANEFSQFKVNLGRAPERAAKLQELASKETNASLQPKGFFNVPELTKNRAPGTRGAAGVDESTATMLDAAHSDPAVAGSKFQQVMSDPALSMEYKKGVETFAKMWQGTLDEGELYGLIPDWMRSSTKYSYEPKTYNIFELKKLAPEARQAMLKDPNTPANVSRALQDIESGVIDRQVSGMRGSAINKDFLKKRTNPDPQRVQDELYGLSDPVYSHSLTAQRIHTDAAHYQFIDAAKQKGFVTDVNPGNYVDIADVFKGSDAGIAEAVRGGKWGNYKWMEPGMAYEYTELLKGPPKTGPLGKIHTGWKALQTVYNPKNQIANRMTNGIMSWIDHGIVPGDQYTRDAWKVLKQRETNPLYNLAKDTGLIDSSYVKQELGQGVQSALAPLKTAQTTGEKIKYLGKGLLSKPGEFYQGAETEGKMAIFLKKLRQKGVDYQNGQLSVNGRAVDMSKPFAADAELFKIAQEGTQAAHKTLFNYGEQSRMINALRTNPLGVPFITFYANFFPSLLRWASGRNTLGAIDPMVALRFWAIPGSLWLLNEYGKAKTGTTPEQDAINRNALPDANRKSMIPALHGLENPRMPFNIDAQGVPVSADTAGSKPSYLPMGNVMPFDPWSSQTGAMSIPSMLAPLSGPLAQAGIMALTGRQPYTQKQVIDKNSTPDKLGVYAKELMNLFTPQIVKQALPGGRLNSAVQGIAPNNFEARQSPSMAALNVLSPFRPVGVDVAQANKFKGSQARKAKADWTYGMAKDLQNLEIRRAKMKPAQYAAERQKIEQKYLRAMQEWMKQQYPHKPPSKGR